MAKTIEELLIEANAIKNETVAGQNTADRVGSLFADIVDYLRDSGGGGGTPQVQSDWNQSDESKVSYIQNKPNLALKQDTLVSGVNIKTINNQSILGSGDFPIGGGGQIQSDWGQTDTSAADFIKNKPYVDVIEEVNKSNISNVTAFLSQKCANMANNNIYYHAIKVIDSNNNRNFFIDITALCSSADYKEFKICGYLTETSLSFDFAASLEPSNYKEYAIKINSSNITDCVPLIYEYSFDSSTANLNIS